jgi:hypothetical protein
MSAATVEDLVKYAQVVSNAAQQDSEAGVNFRLSVWNRLGHNLARSPRLDRPGAGLFGDGCDLSQLLLYSPPWIALFLGGTGVGFSDIGEVKKTERHRYGFRLDMHLLRAPERRASPQCAVCKRDSGADTEVGI